MLLFNDFSKFLKTITDFIKAALGEIKSDLIIHNANLVNVCSGEIQENICIAIYRSRIVYVGKDKPENFRGPNTIIIDAKNRYVSPGLLDAHVHVESSMVTLTQFAKAVLPHGTTGIFADPHEICNVLGEQGLLLMIEESKNLPLKFFLQVPSCVPPSSSGVETPGAVLNASTVKKLIINRIFHSLGEVMDYYGVIYCDHEMLEKIKATLEVNKIVTGHAPLLRGKELAAYITSGVSSCHENTTWSEALEKLQLGLRVIIREGSAWRDVKDVIKIVTEQKVDHHRILLATDDRHPRDIIKEGHMDFVVRRVIEEGVDPIKAIQMATINTATYYGLDSQIGSVSPGKIADLLIISDLTRMIVDDVIANGRIIVKNGKLIVDFPHFTYPDNFKRTVKLKKLVRPEDFEIKSSKVKSGQVKANIIEVVEAKTITRHVVETVPVRNYVVEPDLEKDIILAAVVERHHFTGNIGKGLVKGFGLKSGAFASTVSHDTHNIVVIGTNRSDMSLAVNSIAKIGGGLITVDKGEIRAVLDLPIAGLISEEPLESVANKLEQIENSLKSMGCKLRSAFMTISLLALTVIPEIRLSDKGLVDVNQMKIIPVLIED